MGAHSDYQDSKDSSRLQINVLDTLFKWREAGFGSPHVLQILR